MADIDHTALAVNATDQQRTWWNLSERLLGGILRLVGFRQNNEQLPNSPRLSPRSSNKSSPRRSPGPSPRASPRCSPRRSPFPISGRHSRPGPDRSTALSSTRSPCRTDSSRIDRRERLRDQRRVEPAKNRNTARTFLPSLSQDYAHKTHNECFASHLIDAVRLYKYLTRLQDEQAESEKVCLDLRAKVLDSAIQLEALRNFNDPQYAYVIDESAFLIDEHKDCIRTSNEGIEKCKREDEERAKKFRYIRHGLDSAMEDLFETVDDYVTHSGSIRISTSLEFALRICRETYQQVADAALEARSANQAEPHAEDREAHAHLSERTDLIVARKQARKRRDDARALFWKCRADFFERHAIEAAGDKADLPHALNEGNLEKLRAQQYYVEMSRLSTDRSLEIGSDRDADGRPLNNGRPLLPPTDENLRLVVAEHGPIRDQFHLSKKRQDEMREFFFREFAKTLVLHPEATPQSFRSRCTLNGRPFQPTFREVVNAKAQRAQVFLQSVERIAGSLWDANEMGWTGPAFEPHHSDYNCSSEAPSQHALRRLQGDPRKMRRWNRELARHCLPGQVELTEPPESRMGSRELQSYPSWPWDQLPETEDFEIRQERLQAHDRAMDDERLEAARVRAEWIQAEWEMTDEERAERARIEAEGNISPIPDHESI